MFKLNIGWSGVHMKTLFGSCLVLEVALAVTPSAAQIVTSQYDNLRTGATLNEKVLSPQNVNAKRFGKVGAFKVDGAVYATALIYSVSRDPGQRNA